MRDPRPFQDACPSSEGPVIGGRRAGTESHGAKEHPGEHRLLSSGCAGGRGYAGDLEKKGVLKKSGNSWTALYGDGCLSMVFG